MFFLVYPSHNTAILWIIFDGCERNREVERRCTSPSCVSANYGSETSYVWRQTPTVWLSSIKRESVKIRRDSPMRLNSADFGIWKKKDTAISVRFVFHPTTVIYRYHKLHLKITLSILDACKKCRSFQNDWFFFKDSRHLYGTFKETRGKINFATLRELFWLICQSEWNEVNRKYVGYLNKFKSTNEILTDFEFASRRLNVCNTIPRSAHYYAHYPHRI